MAAKQEPEWAPLDLNEVVDEALLFVRHDIEARSIYLSARLAADLPKVLGDRIQLQQVIVNLLVNGIQAIAQGDGSLRRIEGLAELRGVMTALGHREYGLHA